MSPLTKTRSDPLMWFNGVSLVMQFIKHELMINNKDLFVIQDQEKTEVHFGRYILGVFRSLPKNYYCLTALHKTCQFFFLIGRDKESKDVGEREAF